MKILMMVVMFSKVRVVFWVKRFRISSSGKKCFV